MKKHFVLFLSPGTFFPEQTEKPIDAWNVNEAVKMAHKVSERYGATPYAFSFFTRERGPNDLDSKVTKRSHNYFLGGKIETRAEIEKRNDPKEEILRSNMKCNGYDRVLTNTNSYRVTCPLNKDDEVLDFVPKKGKS